MAWTDERIARLKKLDAEGYSFSQIAADLGGGLTRNACIGKARRIGLPMRGKSPGRGPERPKPKTVKVKRLVLASSHNNMLRIIETEKPETEPMSKLSPDDIPLAQRKQLLELGPDDCRWPYGDPGQPDFFFCSGPKLSGCSYCVFHQGVASGGNRYRPVSDLEHARRSAGARLARERRLRNQWDAA